MSTPHLTSKLDHLAATLDLCSRWDATDMSEALRQGSGRNVIAIGSGGSIISAEYFSLVRDTMALGETVVQTPMQAVLGYRELSNTDVWVFTAGGNNADVVAAVEAVLDRNCTKLHVVTRNVNGAVAELARIAGQLHVVPVADEKDGYLATHSLLATIVCLLLASDEVSRDGQGRSDLLASVTARLARILDPAYRDHIRGTFSGLRATDTLVLAADPTLRPASVLLDTSFWEAALCPIQTTDLRNLAHGRHAWLHHRTETTFLLALFGGESSTIWDAIEQRLPDDLARAAMGYGAGGRLENVLAILDGLGVVEAVGSVLGIDPGKPGVGQFGREMYADQSLRIVGSALSVPVRRKRSAVARTDGLRSLKEPLSVVGEARLASLASVEVGGLVFDWDGTLVETHDRRRPPSRDIVEQLTRLHHAGLRLGIATGRGGSAGEELRRVLPRALLEAILIGYYNGGYLRTANIDIATSPPVADPNIGEAAGWLRARVDLFADREFKEGPVQISLDFRQLRRPHRFLVDIGDCPNVASGAVRVVASGHSFDLVPFGSSKLSVVDVLQSQVGLEKVVLCFGDSGSEAGNDYALLSHPFGISVGDVCGSAEGCWTLPVGRLSGPNALLTALRALVASPQGGIRLDPTLLAAGPGLR